MNKRDSLGCDHEQNVFSSSSLLADETLLLNQSAVVFAGSRSLLDMLNRAVVLKILTSQVG
jgi:hypothetical protein